jgi:single-strand DNA-binding protein
MAAGDTQITIAGNLVSDPELRYTPTGQAVATFRVASTPRFMDRNTNEWKDGESLFLSCNVWRQAAENVAESLQRGMRVIVNGRLRQRQYETREGEKRTVYEIEVDDVGPSLRNASAKVTKSNRSGGGGGGGFGGGGGGNSGGGGQGGGNGRADHGAGVGVHWPDSFRRAGRDSRKNREGSSRQQLFRADFRRVFRPARGARRPWPRWPRRPDGPWPRCGKRCARRTTRTRSC